MEATSSLVDPEDPSLRKFEEERSKFETNFVHLNCEIQNVRSEVHQLKDGNLFMKKSIEVNGSSSRN